MGTKGKLAEKAVALEAEFIRLESQRRVLRDEMRILEREVYELHHLRAEKDGTCPFCKRAFTSEVIDNLLVEREEELEGIISALDDVREHHAEVETHLVDMHRKMSGGTKDV